MTTLTCNCRFCGFNICYGSENVGQDSRCSNCGQTIRLPGRLAAVTSMRRARRKDRVGLAMEIGGFAMMPFLYPIGIFAGAVTVYFGWKKSTHLVCSHCSTPVKDPSQSQCSGCKSKFGSD